ncbi:hypothetical protein Tco_0726946 [Tanacetum coccineum]|uniref:Uncharacterized protein n=1 Tax=Tanacetum coccineum TaxID=301880 RepID=A0ABQ4YJA3_9ASTR
MLTHPVIQKPSILNTYYHSKLTSNPRNQATVQDGRVVVQNVQGRQNRGQGNNATGTGATGYGGAQNRVGNANPDNAIDEDVDEQPVQDLALNVDNVFQADDYLVVDKDHPSYDSDILSEVQDHDHFQDAICEHHEEHGMQDDVQPSYVVGSHADYTSDSNTISQYISSKWYQRSAIIQNNASNGSQIDDDKTEDER